MDFFQAIKNKANEAKGKLNSFYESSVSNYKNFFDGQFKKLDNGNVEFKDFLNISSPVGLNLKSPATDINVGKKILETGKDVAQGIARSGGSVGIHLNNLLADYTGLTKKIDRMPAPNMVNPKFTDHFQSLIFGKDADVLSIEEALKEGRKTGKKIAGTTGELISPFAVGGFMALDFTGLGPEKKGVQESLNFIAKSKKAEEIIPYIDDIFSKIKVDKNIIGDTESLAKELVNTNTVEDVNKAINYRLESNYKNLKGWGDDPNIFKTVKKSDGEYRLSSKLDDGAYVVTKDGKTAGVVKANDVVSFLKPVEELKPVLSGEQDLTKIFSSGGKMSADEVSMAVQDFKGLSEILSNFKSGDEFSRLYEVASRKGKVSADDGFSPRDTKLINQIVEKKVDGINFKKVGEMTGINFKDEFGSDFFDYFSKNIQNLPQTATVAGKETVKKAEKSVIKSFSEYQDEITAMASKGKPQQFADSTLTTERERGFITTMKESPKTSPQVKEKLAGNYDVLTDKEVLKQAEDMLNFDYDKAYRMAMGVDEFEKTAPTKLSNAIASKLINEKQLAGQYEEAIKIIESVAERATNAGQAIQALSMWNKLTPEGYLKWANKVVTKGNAEIADETKKIVLSTEKKIEIMQKVKDIQKITNVEEKAFETAKLNTEILTLFPSSIARKISGFQTIAQLLNPKTFIRNIIGNVGFSAIENVKDVPAAALDSALSLFTKVRTKTLPAIDIQAKGALKGLKQGIRDAIHGVDTSGVSSKFDIPQTPIFKDKTIMGYVEKLLNVELRAPDRAMYQAAYDGSLYQSLKAENINRLKKGLEPIDTPTEEMKELAHYEGLYRTFQDDNTLTYLFTKLKSTLNTVGFGGTFRNREFGLGDFVLKYPKTPANLINRGLAYSPAGFINAVYVAAKPLIGKTKYTKAVQKEFVDSFARALTGTTGLVGAGALMHRLGIITGERPSDTDIALASEQAGLGGYRLNLSGLKRFVLSLDPSSAKVKDGDTLINYDWFQPLAIGISVGANIDQTAGKSMENLDSITTLLESVGSGVDTFGDQPLISNLTRLFKKEKISDVAFEVVKGMPSSLVPTFISQIRQLTDNTARNTYDQNFVQEAFNRAKYRVPFLANTLPPRITTLGETKEVYQNGSNNLFNVLFNPAFKTVYKGTPENELILDLYNQTGETQQAPRYINKSMTVNGESVKIGPVTQTKMQMFVGTATKNYFHSLAQDERFMALSDEDKIKYMSNVLTDISSAAKIIILGDRPKKTPSSRTQFFMSQYLADPNFQSAIESFNKYSD